MLLSQTKLAILCLVKCCNFVSSVTENFRKLQNFTLKLSSSVASSLQGVFRLRPWLSHLENLTSKYKRLNVFWTWPVSKGGLGNLILLNDFRIVETQFFQMSWKTSEMWSKWLFLAEKLPCGRSRSLWYPAAGISAPKPPSVIRLSCTSLLTTMPKWDIFQTKVF